MNELVERLSRIRDACRRENGSLIPLGEELQRAITALESADRFLEAWDAGTSRQIIDAADAYRAATQKKG